MSRTDGAIAHFHTRRHLLLGLTALAGLAACGGGSSGSRVTGAAAVTDRQIGVAPGVSLHVRDWPADTGNGEDVIVLLAGLGANAHAFDSLAPALARRHRVLAITRRGYGQSGKPLPAGDATYAPATLVADLLAVLDALQVRRVILAGHSIAGNEVSLFAASHPARVRGLVYLDTTFDYGASGGDEEEESESSPLDEPQPAAADLASMAASIAFAKRVNKQWWPALEACWRDTLDVQADGSVRPNTPAAVADAMARSAHRFSPDYRAVRAPALVVTVDPSTLRDLLPWLSPQADAATLAAAHALLDFFRPLRLADGERLAAALPGSTHLVIDKAYHSDFFIEYETTVVQAIATMRWDT